MNSPKIYPSEEYSDIDSYSNNSDEEEDELPRQLSFDPTKQKGWVNKSLDIRRESKSANANYLIWIIISAVIFSVVGVAVYLMVEQNDTPAKYDSDYEKALLIKRFETQMKRMKSLFPKQEMHMWEEIFITVNETIYHPKQPSMIILVATDNHPMACLANLIGHVVKDILGGKQTLILKAADLGDNTGEVIDKYRPKINNSKTMVIHDLLNVHPEALKAFHNFCDRQNPLVSGAVYIMTMFIADEAKLYAPLQVVEQQLRSRLTGKIDKDTIGALVIRITDASIFTVNPEPLMRSCPSW